MAFAGLRGHAPGLVLVLLRSKAAKGPAALSIGCISSGFCTSCASRRYPVCCLFQFLRCALFVEISYAVKTRRQNVHFQRRCRSVGRAPLRNTALFEDFYSMLAPLPTVACFA